MESLAPAAKSSFHRQLVAFLKRTSVVRPNTLETRERDFFEGHQVICIVLLPSSFPMFWGQNSTIDCRHRMRRAESCLNVIKYGKELPYLIFFFHFETIKRTTFKNKPRFFNNLLAMLRYVSLIPCRKQLTEMFV